MQSIDESVLIAMENHFHALIQARAVEFGVEGGFALPRLASLLESDGSPEWFPVPGMYGGFQYWLAKDGSEAMLVTESWCRVVDGSGQRHQIVAGGIVLVDEGFV